MNFDQYRLSQDEVGDLGVQVRELLEELGSIADS